MKKILRQGDIDYRTVSKFVGHCFNCDTQFEYEAEDLHYNQYIHHQCVSCPTCNHEIFHDYNPRGKVRINTERL